MKEVYCKISKFVDENKSDIINSLIRLVKIPSVVSEGQNDMPFGQAVNDALYEVKKLFCESGYNMEVKQNLGYALLQIGSSEKSIGIFSHADVVPVKDDWKYSKPFEPAIVCNKLFGRGSEDNKSGVIASLFALKALKNSGVKLKNGITVFVGGCEECAMKDIDNFVKNEKMPFVSLVPDSSFPFSLGEKGIIHLDCFSIDKFNELKAFEGGSAYNVILDEVIVRINFNEALFDELKQQAAEVRKDGNDIILTVKGVTKHAAMPEGSVNAACEAAKLLCEMKNLNENDKKVLTALKEVLADYYGAGLGIEHEDEFGKLTAANGIVKVTDGKMYFSVDIRYGTGADGDEIVRKASKTMEKYGYSVKTGLIDPGFLLDEKGRVTEAVLNAYKGFTNDLTAKAYKNSGGTYARHLKNAYALGTTTSFSREGLELPPGHGQIHQSDEYIDIEGFLQGIKIIAAAIYETDMVI